MRGFVHSGSGSQGGIKGRGQRDNATLCGMEALTDAVLSGVLSANFYAHHRSQELPSTEDRQPVTHQEGVTTPW